MAFNIEIRRSLLKRVQVCALLGVQMCFQCVSIWISVQKPKANTEE